MFNDINTLYIAFWIILLVAFLIVEAESEALISIWFAAGSIPSLILATLKTSFILQLAVFTAASALFLFLSKIVFKKALKGPSDKGNELKTNVDGLIGKFGIAKDEINLDKTGYVKVNGMDWLAYTTNEEAILPNDKIKIISVEGVKLKIEKVN